MAKQVKRSSPTRWWRFTKVFLRNGRWIGVLGFLCLLFLSSGNERLSSLIEGIHSELAAGLRDCRLAWNDRLQLVLRHPQGAPEGVRHVWRKIIQVNSGQVKEDLLYGVLDFIHSSWRLTASSFQILFQLLKVGTLGLVVTAPYIAPVLNICGREWMLLSSKARIIVVATFVLNVCMLTAWRRGVFIKVVKFLSSCHRKVADISVAAGPYALILALLYAPTKNTLSAAAFRTLFQDLVYAIAIFKSCLTCFKLLWTLRQATVSQRATPPPKAVFPQSARPASVTQQELASTNHWLDYISPRGPTSLTPRDHTDRKANLQIAVHDWLTFWVVLSFAQGMFYLPERLAERLPGSSGPLPLFNIWSIAGHRLRPSQRLFLSQSAVLGEEYHSSSHGGGFGTTKRRKLGGLFSSVIVASEEVMMLCLLFSALTHDSKVAAHCKRICARTLEWLVCTMTGFKFELSPKRSINGQPKRPSDEPTGILHHFKQVVVDNVHRIKALGTILRLGHIRGLVVNLPMLTSLLLPLFLLKFIFLVVALLAPTTYGLRALQQASLEKSAYWLLYFTSLVVAMVVQEIAAGSSSITAWIVFGLRIRMAVVVLLQFICTEPETLGVWVVSQASKVSVTALATARRHGLRVSMPATSNYHGPINRSLSDLEVLPPTPNEDFAPSIVKRSRKRNGDGSSESIERNDGTATPSTVPQRRRQNSVVTTTSQNQFL